MIKKGFTYVELMVAVSIFLIMAVFVIKLDWLGNKNTRDGNEELKMMYIAQGQLERYKSSPDDVNNNPVDGYYVTITSTPVTSIVREVTVTVKKSPASSGEGDVAIKCHVLIK